jgi:hypothetical protein
MNNGNDFGQCETKAPATDKRTVSEELLLKNLQSLQSRVNSMDEQFGMTLGRLMERVRELEADRDVVVERQIQRRLMNTSSDGCDLQAESLSKRSRY